MFITLIFMNEGVYIFASEKVFSFCSGISSISKALLELHFEKNSIKKFSFPTWTLFLIMSLMVFFGPYDWIWHWGALHTEWIWILQTYEMNATSMHFEFIHVDDPRNFVFNLDPQLKHTFKSAFDRELNNIQPHNPIPLITGWLHFCITNFFV